tara:strand:- start:487 stop:1680 length:1194 start_codon:yes stop_codon:yes gene_type:complete
MGIKKQIFGWGMYDFANTIFSALFVTVYFPLFVVLKGGNAFHVGLVFSASMLLAGLLVPFLGAIADITQRKKFLLFMFTAVCCIFTFFTGFFVLSIVLFFGLLANFFYHAGLDVYDSLLVNVSSERNIGRISGIGTAMGYLGTILAILVAYIIGFYYGFESVNGIKIVFMLTGVLFFGFAGFTFVLVKHKPRKKIEKKDFKKAFYQVISTIKGIRKFKYVWLFLLASFFYVDAANTVIIFLFLFGRDQLGIGVIEFLPLYFVMALSAAIGSFIFGYMTDKVGHKKILNLILGLWVLLILGLFLKTNYLTFVLAGIFGGALLGGLWTVTRPILVDLAPKKKTAELFGYQGLTEKFSGVIGPVLFGVIAVSIGFRYALLGVIGLFLAGALVLSFVKSRK